MGVQAGAVQALSIHEELCNFRPADSGVWLRPNAIPSDDLVKGAAFCLSLSTRDRDNPHFDPLGHVYRRSRP